MPLFYQSRAALHFSQPSHTSAAPSGSIPAGSTLSFVVPGFRYLLRRLPVSGVALSLFAAAIATAFCPTPAQARRAKRQIAQVEVAKPTGVWAWTSGSQTYIRVRPGVQTPPVAKVERHTKLFVWGSFNGWYRVETLDHKFGWIHNEYLNSPDLSKAHEMSHFAAKEASDRTENQVMYGSVEMLKKHYDRYGAAGAKKGLAQMGVQFASKKPVAKAAAIARIQPKVVKPAPQVAQAQPTKAAVKSVAKAPAVKAPVAKVPVAAPKPAVAKVAPQPAKAVAQLAQPKPTQAVIPVAETTKAPLVKVPVVQATPKAVVATAVTPSGSPLHPSLPTVANVSQAPVKAAAPAKHKAARTAAAQRLSPFSLSPAIPMTGRNAKNLALPQISAEELLRARQEHLRQKPATVTPAPEETGSALFIPSSYSPSTLPRNNFSPRAESGSAHVMTLDLDYVRPEARPTTHTESTLPAIIMQAKPVAPKPAAKPAPTVIAKNPVPVKKAAIKSVQAPIKLAMGPARGGSPRDLAVGAGAFGSDLATSALSFRGRPYISGAASPSRGFDCSGLVYYLLRQRGMNPPRTAAGLAHYGKPVAVGQLQPGDLILFSNTYKRGVSHVGVYLGNNNFVHAATHSEGVRVDSLAAAYYCRKYYGARRVN